MNISSIVVQTRSDKVETLVELIKACDFCEYHLHDEKGRIIVTLEGKGVDEEITKLKKLQGMEHVVSAEMMYSYSENELDELKTKLEKDESVPNWLNDDSVRAEDIQYKGDLKKRL